ncbi:MAG: ARPP-1 family domain-containing protein [Candidatus Hodarchaeales archaeon]
MQEMSEFFNNVELGEGEIVDGIGILPLRMKSPLSSSYTTITQAIDQKLVEILESESVNHLKLKILDPETHILIPFLQVVGGGKQDRMVTRPLIVKTDKANEIVDIPVNCIERGRWQYSRESTGTQTTAQFIAHKAVRMSPSMGSVNVGAEQQQTWSSIDYYQSKKKISREKYSSASFMEVEEEVQKGFDEDSKITQPVRELLDRAISSLPDQTGMAFFIGDKLQAIELYGSSSLWSSQSDAVKNSFLSEIDLHEQVDKSIEPQSLKKILLDQLSKVQLAQESDDAYGQLKKSSQEEKYASLILEHQNNVIELYYAPKSAEMEENLTTNQVQIQMQSQNQAPEMEQIQQVMEPVNFPVEEDEEE